MSTPAIEIAVPAAETVAVTEDTLTVKLSDGRSLSVPLAWFPRLVHATAAERRSWRLIGRGHGIHWSKLDEDISVEGLLAGKHSGESQASFKKWLANRTETTTRRSTRRIRAGRSQLFSPARYSVSLHFSARSSSGNIVLPTTPTCTPACSHLNRCR